MPCFLLQNMTAFYTIDGTFFPKRPMELLRERHFHSVPFLVGFNNHEFGWLIPRVSVIWLLCFQVPAPASPLLPQHHHRSL